MIRISTIFVGICMVLIAASLGLVVYGLIGLRVTDAAIVAVAGLGFLILFNAVSSRLRDRNDSTVQIAALSRGTADLARQITEFGRRLAAVESRMTQAPAADAQAEPPVLEPLLGELTELGTLVRQLAVSVAEHDDMLTSLAVNGLPPPAPAMPPDMPPDILPDVLEDLALANGPDPVSQPAVAERARAAVPAKAPRPSTNAAEVTAAIRRAVETNQIDVFLQPVVTLPQRKVKFYEVLSRLRGTSDQLITASDFVAMAEQAGMMPPLDYLALFRCVQVLRRLTVRNKEVGAFCNISRATLRNITSFQQCLDFLEANRALAPLLVLEFKQSTFQNLGPVESEHLAALAQRGFRFSIDNITDLRIDPRELADRGVRFIKVPATLLLDPDATATSEIHAADLSDLLGRFGIELIAEQIETERTAVDLLDFDIHYGQGHLFSPPRPLRPETPAAVAPASGSPQAKPDTAPPRAGLAALARRAGSS